MLVGNVVKASRSLGGGRVGVGKEVWDEGQGGKGSTNHPPEKILQ